MLRIKITLRIVSNFSEQSNKSLKVTGVEIQNNPFQTCFNLFFKYYPSTNHEFFLHKPKSHLMYEIFGVKSKDTVCQLQLHNYFAWGANNLPSRVSFNYNVQTFTNDSSR